jgi:cytochrome P450
MIGAACHDPAVFPDPYRFDIDRSNAKDHLAFGHGIHTCIGNAITRHLVPMVLRKVVERVDRLELATGDDAVEWETMTARSRHLKTLRVVAA